MRTLKLLCLSFAVLLSIPVNAALVTVNRDPVLTAEKSSETVRLSLTEIPQNLKTNKPLPVRVKLSKQAKQFVKVKPSRVRIPLDADNTGSAEVVFSLKARGKNASEDVGLAYSLVPNKKGKKAGIDKNTKELTVLAGDTASFSVVNNFSGDPILPQSGSSASEILVEAKKALDAGVPFRVSFPGNAGSCGLGLGGSPTSTTTGPGGAEPSPEQVPGGLNVLGPTDGEGPVVISFNNPQNGGENASYDINGLPEEFLAPEGIPAFAQFYEGFGASGDVLISLAGTAVIDEANETINLTTPEGIVISFSNDGSKDVTVPAGISELVNDLGGLDASLGILSGDTVPLTIPKAQIESSLQSSLAAAPTPNGALTNINVSLASDLNGNMTLTNNSQLSGTFTGDVTVSFDVPDIGTIAIPSSTGNFSLMIDASKPANLNGFTIDSANFSVNITGGTGEIQSMQATGIITGASVTLGGATSTGTSITQVSTTPSLDSFSGPSTEQCVSDCVAQGGSVEICTPACEANPSNPDVPQGPTVDQCITECTAQGGTLEVCTPACQANPSNPQIPDQGSGGSAFDQCIQQCTAQGGDDATCQQNCQQFQ